MANSRQVSVLLERLKRNEYCFPAGARVDLHNLARHTRIRPTIPGYVVEVDGHPLNIRSDWPGIEQWFDVHLVSVVAPKPFAVRAMHMTVGKPTSYSLARAIRAAVLEPCGVEELASAPALVVLDGDAVCRTDALFRLIEACGSRRILAKRGTPYAKPHVEGAGAMLQRAAIYPVNSLLGLFDEREPEGTLALPMSNLARSYSDALRSVNEPRLNTWSQAMHNCALGLHPEKIARIAAFRWPTRVVVRDGAARLDTEETFLSPSIADLESGLYLGTRSLDCTKDDLQIFVEDECVARGDRAHPFPPELREFIEFVEGPRI